MKLTFHHTSNTNSICESIVFHPDDFNDAKPNDIIELTQTIKDSTTRILLKIPKKELCEIMSPVKGTISIPSALGRKFEMKSNADVHVKVMSPKDLEPVTLHHVELVFQDQYYSRSDMLRMRNFLMNKVLFYEEKVELMKMRAKVEELWCNVKVEDIWYNFRVTCGLITDKTRVSFRSSSAQVHIFIQMSTEMWSFDNYGQLYFEKAVDGYLSHLFKLWKEKKCSHDVTITLFSRTFYDIKSIDEFPDFMKEWIREDNTGKFYEDFYRVVVQNERYEDWSKTIGILKELFASYDNDVLHFYENKQATKSSRKDSLVWNPTAAMGLKNRERCCSDNNEKSAVDKENEEFLKSKPERKRRKSYNTPNLIIISKAPPSFNSTASEGNVLEVINMALNVYEKFYMDRSFERTGKMSMIITPGVGVFDVNRELMNITKQRSIDIGSSCDLICLGERPLFAVPLFRINQDHVRYPHLLVEDDYNIPHWLNLSYYNSKVQMECQIQDKVMLNADLLDIIAKCNAATENKMSTCKPDNLKQHNKEYNSCSKLKVQVDDDVSFINYDDYDAKVFKYQSKPEQQDKFSYLPFRTTRVKYGERRERVSFTIATCGLFSDNQENKSPNMSIAQNDNKNEEYLSHSFSGKVADSDNHSSHCKRMAGSVTYPYSHHRIPSLSHNNKNTGRGSATKTLVNPFYPSKLNFKSTSNRNRWAHAYPSGLPNSFHKNNNISQMFRSLRENASPSRESTFSETSSAFKLTKPRQKHTSECSETIFNPGSYIESPPKHFADNIINNFKQFPQVGSTSSLASSGNDMCGSLNRCKSSISSKPLHPYARRMHTLERDMYESHMMECKTGDLENNFPVYATMDWKSMTIPPILPITTDYFPDKYVLEQFYLYSEYTLVSEEIDLRFSGVYGSRHTPTLKEVFYEMIYQRVAQGFQIIIEQPTHQTVVKKSGFHKSHSQSVTQPLEEIMMSMGRLFHKLTLHEKDIVVRRYSPRHRFSQQGSYKYSYRFQVPDSFYFDSSLTCFKTETLDMYNWNYVDHHLLTQGEDSARFLESLKFWRARFVLLPCNNAGTKVIQDEKCKRGNVYNEKDLKEKKELIDGFLKFIEFINGIKRMPQKANLRNERRGSLGLTIPKYEKKIEDINDNYLYPPQNITVFVDTSGGEHYTCTESSTYSKVVNAMLDPTHGLNFIISPYDWIKLPPLSFISSDAVTWLMNNVKGLTSISKATDYMQKLVYEKLICQTHDKFTFIYGFKIYCILSETTHNYQFQQIEQNFVEVEIQPGIEEEDSFIRRRSTQPSVAMSKMKPSKSNMNSDYAKAQPYSNNYLYKYVRLEIDNTSQERQEWGVLKHHKIYTPTCAFELAIEWLVATGSILAEQVNSWSRKASTFGFHLLPIPSDPFALPFVAQSDPLRGPIYIPMDVDCLEVSNWSKLDQIKLLDFQDQILKSFGFMRDKCTTSMNLSEDYMSSKPSELPIYIHCTGGMLMMVVSTLTRRMDSKRILQETKNSTKTTPDQYEDFVVRQYKQVAQGKGSRLSSTHIVGFLWAWNYMLSKKWMTAQTGNDAFQDTILHDLRLFNSNDEGRLKIAWDKFKSSHNSDSGFYNY